MTRYVPRLAFVLLALASVACEANKSANPLSPTVAGPIPGVNITAPRPIEPANGSKYPPDNQPITLTVENAASNGVRPLTYLFQVATDSNFTTIVFTRDGITPGGNGKTSLRLADALASGRTYYWRARAQDGANTGPFFVGVPFQVLQPISIQAPALMSPVGGVTVGDNPPTLKIRNANRSGPVGAMAYLVQVSKNESFTAIVYQELAGEQPNETHVTPTSRLTASTRFFWRARAQDPSNEGPWSSTGTFLTPAPPAEPEPTPSPEPTPQPSPGGGGGSCASSDGDAIIACVSAKYASYRRAGVSSGQRRSNMEFLRDRIIEAGLCGGLDLGWNLKRGGPEVSVDFITERRGGTVVGHDIAFDYDNTSKELKLYWGGGTFPFYAKYTRSFSCN